MAGARHHRRHDSAASCVGQTSRSARVLQDPLLAACSGANNWLALDYARRGALPRHIRVRYLAVPHPGQCGRRRAGLPQLTAAAHQPHGDCGWHHLCATAVGTRKRDLALRIWFWFSIGCRARPDRPAVRGDSLSWSESRERAHASGRPAGGGCERGSERVPWKFFLGLDALNTATLLFARQPLAYARGSVPHPFGAATVRERNFGPRAT